MVRICPNCKQNLGSFDHFFCTSCGFALPVDIQQPDAKAVRIADFARDSKKSHELNPTLKAITQNLPMFVNKKLMLAGGVSVLLILVLVTGLSRIQSVFIKSVAVKNITNGFRSTNPPVVSDLISVAETTMSLKSGDFSKSLYANYLPFDVEIMIEGYDFDSFLSFFGARYTQFTPIINLIKDKTDNHFVVFATKSGLPKETAGIKAEEVNTTQPVESYDSLVWSVLFYPTNSDFNLPPEILEFNKNLIFVKSDPIFLLTTEKSIADKVLDAKGKVAKSLAQTPAYIKVVPFITGNNKLFVLIKGESGATFFRDYNNEIKGTPEAEIIAKSIIDSPERNYFLFK